MRRTFIATAGLCLALGAAPAPAQAQVNVVTTNTVLQSLAEEVGGDRVRATSLARGTQDLHYIEPRPSMITVVRRADLVVYQGMQLDDVWLFPVIDQARNRDVARGGNGHVNASVGIRPMAVPVGPVDRRLGDVHPFGNPHYHLDPENARIIARNIMEGLQRVDPQNSSSYQANFNRFSNRLTEKMREWQQTLAPHRGAKVVSYHPTFIYFLQRFGLEDFGTIEHRPGIPPGPAHIATLVEQMRGAGVKVIIREPYYPERIANSVAERAGGAQVVTILEWAGGLPNTDGYFALMDYNVNALARALR